MNRPPLPGDIVAVKPYDPVDDGTVLYVSDRTAMVRNLATNAEHSWPLHMLRVRATTPHSERNPRLIVPSWFRGAL